MKSPSGNEFNLSTRVTQYLMRHIRENDLKTGDKIPSEVQVSTDLGISRGVVRQAYHSLRAAGILDVSMGRAPRVGQVDESAFTPLVDHALRTDQVSPEDVLELRCAVEVHAAELAANNRNPGQVLALMKSVEGMRQCRDLPDRFVKHDVRFHEIVGRATGNKLFGMLSRALHGSLENSIRAGLNSRTTMLQVDRVVDTHQAIAEAIEARQPTRARNMMAVHFDEAKNALQLAGNTAHRSAS